MRKQKLYLRVVLFLGAASAAAGAETPVAVSPGHASALAVVEARCPTFSWGEVEGAAGYELMVYRLGEEFEESAEAEPVLRRSFPGSVESWTPSLDSCFARGGHYAWSVRAVGETETSEWSAPSLFEVAAGPSEGAFEAAMEVVRRYVGASEFAEPMQARATGSGPEAASVRSTSASGSTVAVPSTSAILSSATTAIRGEIAVDPSETTADVVGVAGVADSSGGAGVLAANLSPGGADLVLDGSAESLPDTILTESGLLAGGASFEIGNAGGTLDLIVNGSSVTTEATDADTLAGIGCGGATGVVKWDGAQWLCGDGSGISNVTASALDFEVTGAGIADDAINSAKIANGTISTSDIAFQAIDGVKLAANAVNSSKIADGQVLASDIGNGQVFSAAIADGTIASVDIADGTITRDDVADGTLTGSDIANGTIVSADIADGTLTRFDVKDEAGVEYVSKAATWLLHNQSHVVVETLSASAPVAGHLIVFATANVDYGSEFTCSLTLGAFVESPSFQGSGPVSLTRGFQVGAGTTDINLVCGNWCPNCPAGGGAIRSLEMAAVFSPTRY